MKSQIKLYIKKILETYIIGSRWNEYRWATMHERNSSDWHASLPPSQNKENAWVMEYWDSIRHPHRRLLIEHIARFSPKRVLEVGSHCGPNLYLLAKKYPRAKLVGTDINPKAIKAGKKLFAKEGISNVTLLHKKADQLQSFKDNSFDVVFTDAVLIYVGPDKIMDIASDMLRIARRALVLVEWQPPPRERDPEGLGIYYGSRWKRNYRNLLSQFLPKKNIQATKLTHTQWPDANWSELGYIITATK